METTEIDFRVAVYPAAYVRDWCMHEYRLRTAMWYYHLPRLAKPSAKMAGYEWYTAAEFDAVKDYFRTLPSVRRKSISAGA